MTELERAARAALYLVGNDADRKKIGNKPWGNAGAEPVPRMLRDALFGKTDVAKAAEQGFYGKTAEEDK